MSQLFIVVHESYLSEVTNCFANSEFSPAKNKAAVIISTADFFSEKVKKQQSNVDQVLMISHPPELLINSEYSVENHKKEIEIITHFAMQYYQQTLVIDYSALKNQLEQVKKLIARKFNVDVDVNSLKSVQNKLTASHYLQALISSLQYDELHDGYEELTGTLSLSSDLSDADNNERLKAWAKLAEKENLQLSTDNGQLKSKIETLTTDSLKLKADCQQSNAEAELTLLQVHQLQEELESKYQEATSQIKANETLTAEKLQLSTDNEKLKSEMAIQSADSPKLNAEFADLQSENELCLLHFFALFLSGSAITQRAYSSSFK